MNFQRKKVAIALGIGGVALVAGGTASAQDIRVNVTGTNIKRVDSETSAPIETITREDIQASGLQTIQEVVRGDHREQQRLDRAVVHQRLLRVRHRRVAARPRPQQHPRARQRPPHRELRPGRRRSRVVSPTSSQLPFDAVERIEILKDGASAIYGSDAVAGVVNMILRQQFTGFTATATAGQNYNGEGDKFKVVGHRRHRRPHEGQVQRVPVHRLPEVGCVPSNTDRDYIGSNDLRFMGLEDQRLGNTALAARASCPAMCGR